MREPSSVLQPLTAKISAFPNPPKTEIEWTGNYASVTRIYLVLLADVMYLDEVLFVIAIFHYLSDSPN